MTIPKLLPEPGDVDRELSGVALHSLSPDSRHYPLSRHHSAGVAGQEKQQFELHVGELDSSLTCPHLVAVAVYGEITQYDPAGHTECYSKCLFFTFDYKRVAYELNLCYLAT